MTEPMHCDHECVCRFYGLNIDLPDPCKANKKGHSKCEFDTRARGPVQQAPAPMPNDYRELFIRDLLYNFRWTAEHGNPEFFKAVEMIKREYLKPESQLLEQHDAALLAQEREKWERERAQSIDVELVYYPISEGEIRSILDLEHIPKDATNEQIFSANTKMLAALLNRDPVIIRGSSSAETIAAQAREDVLKDLREAFSHVRSDNCFGEMNSDKCTSYNDNGECLLCAFDSIVDSLCSGVKK